MLTTNEEFAQIIEGNKSIIARYVWEEANERNLSSYKDIPVDTLEKMITPTLNSIAHYLRNENATEYREFIRETTLTRLKNGFKLDDLFLISNVIRNGIVRVVEATLVAPEQTRQKERYLRRLQGIQSLSQTTQIAAQFDFDKTKATK